jgi:hypothetical protein
MARLLHPDLGQVLLAADALIQRRDPTQRIRLPAALGVIFTLGALVILFIRRAGRTARWYAKDDGQHPRWTPPSIASQDGMPRDVTRSTGRPES